MIGILPKCYRKCTKKINLLPSRQISKTEWISNFFVKNEEMDKFGLNYHRSMVQPLVLRILMCSF